MTFSILFPILILNLSLKIVIKNFINTLKVKFSVNNVIKKVKPRNPTVMPFIIFICIFTLSLSLAQPIIVSVAIEPKTLTLSPGSDGKINLVISSGAQAVLAGEFKLTYPIDVVNVTIIGTAEWTVSPVPSDPRLFIFYRNQGVPIDNRSTLAIILVRALRGETNATVRIEHFKAADKDGNDLTISLANNQSIIVISGAGGGETGWQPPPSRPRSTNTSFLVWIALGVALLTAGVFALYQVYRQTTFYLFIDGRPLKLKGSRVVIGREDLAGLLPPEKATYITRKARGGHFLILRQKHTFFIQDLGSTNGTYVNGVDIRGRGLVPLKDGDVIQVPGAFEAVFRSR